MSCVTKYCLTLLLGLLPGIGMAQPSAFSSEYDSLLSEIFLGDAGCASPDVDQCVGGISGAIFSPAGGVSTMHEGLASIGLFANDSTRMGLGDVSQHLVAVLTLRLVEEGEIGLSDQLGNLLPSQFDASIPPSTTIEQLLRHTSGIRSFANSSVDYYDPGNSIVFNDLTLDFAQTPVPFANILGPYVAGQGAPAPAGTFLYSPTNYLLLGLKLEEVTGQSLQTLLDTYVLDDLFENPIGLGDIAVYQPDTVNGQAELADNTTTAYFRFTIQYETLSRAVSLLSSSGASGRLVATPAAMVQYLDALFQGQILSQASLDLLTSFQPISGRLSEAYGMGLERFTLTVSGQQQTYWGHAGNLHHQAVMLYQPDDRVGLFLSRNVVDDFDPAFTAAFSDISAMLEVAEELLAFQAQSVSIDQAMSAGPRVEVFPNPADERITVRYALSRGGETVRMTLHDLAGRIVRRQAVSNSAAEQEVSLSVADLPAGLYTLRVQSANGTVGRKVVLR